MADTTFHGWTVESDEEKNQVTFTKPDEAAEGGQRRVRVSGGKDTLHAIVRATGARNALASDVENAEPGSDALTATERWHAAANHLKRLHADERRRLEGEAEPTPPGGIDAIIDMPTITMKGGAIAPKGGN